MRLFILGATGGIGTELLSQGLERGHQITAFVRSPQKIAREHEQLRVVIGDPRDVGQLKKVLSGHDAVLSSLGNRGLGFTSIREDCARATIQAMNESGVRRLLAVSVAFLFDGIGVPAWILRRVVLRHVGHDSLGMETVIRGSGLDWTIARPPRLTHGQCKQRYRVEDQRLPNGGSKISRADVAHFMLNEVEKPEHLQKVVGVCD
jgi:putative NADH-flavin reductase